MAPVACCPLATFGQPLSGIFADSFQHREAGPATRRASRNEQLMIDKRGDRAEDGRLLTEIRDGFGGFERTSSHKDGEAAKQHLLIHGKKIVAPRDGIGHRLMSFWKVSRTTGQQR
jgi:hypothetical protein